MVAAARWRQAGANMINCGRPQRRVTSCHDACSSTFDIDFLRSEDKYTLVAWRDDSSQPRDAVIRMTLKEVIAKLDSAQFAQVHRSVVVNLRAISHVTRGPNETADIHLKGRTDVLPVSRSHLHVFRQM